MRPALPAPGAQDKPVLVTLWIVSCPGEADVITRLSFDDQASARAYIDMRMDIAILADEALLVSVQT